MRNIILVIGFLTFWMAGIFWSDASSSETGGWQAAKWGMTREQIQAVIPEAKPQQKYVAGTVYSYFGLKSYAVDTCPMSVEFRFDGSGLSGVTMSLEDRSLGSCANTLRELLTDRYGGPVAETRPRNDGLRRDQRETEWLSPSTRILLLSGVWVSQGDFYVQIQYRPRTASSASKL